ncbi:MAG TPA: type I pullulanase [Saprospiraceae bacterium]|nr:type I pullulanase [Saprospiraceae bacterium]HMP25236.1 type I pullulanase [Saprospiraceae bacterium]
MKSIFIALIVLLTLAACQPTPDYADMPFEKYPVYNGQDLGLSYTPQQSVFKIWSPPAQEARVHLYAEGEGGLPLRSQDMRQDKKSGVWTARFDEDLKGQFYAFQVKIKGEWLAEVPDPYAKAVGVNGDRGMVVDLAETNPEGWENDQRPPLAHFNDIVIYELHVRDLSSDPNSGIRHTGKFLGLTETGTRSREGEATGLDHIKDLGVTHVHLLPSFDFKSLDERIADNPKYNWGYDPKNYNVPDGSYATNPFDGAVRIREFKQMVKTLHDNGLRVILDVVYNHTGDTEASLFNQLVPGYYYRQRPDGSFSDASACGNETASERAMVRKFIVESVQHWATEYHLDGFRFDLMGIHDQETMNAVSAALDEIDPTIFVYGEGWTAGDSPLPEEKRALKKYTYKLDRVAAFSDDIRDAIKGHVFTHDAKGFISGLPELEESIKFGIVASTKHPQVQYDAINYSDAPWAREPFQTITYVSCHDNHTLWDRLLLSVPKASETDRIRMHKLAGAIVLTSQGVSFLHAGVELLRTKQGVENSYESPDSINLIDWSRKAQYKPVYNYFKDLIALRKNHPAFRMTSTEQIANNLEFLDIREQNLVAYTIANHANGDTWKNILVVLNGNNREQQISIPAGEWILVLDADQINEKGIRKLPGGLLNVPAIAALVLVQE